MTLDPEWIYGAAGRAAGAEVRLRQAKAAEDEATSALAEATKKRVVAEKEAATALASLNRLVKEMADEKQGIADDPERDGDPPTISPEHQAWRRLDRDFPA